jgi:hypothetical protein
MIRAPKLDASQATADSWSVPQLRRLGITKTP